MKYLAAVCSGTSDYVKKLFWNVLGYGGPASLLHCVTLLLWGNNGSFSTCHICFILCNLENYCDAKCDHFTSWICSYFFVWMTYWEFGESFNKQPNHCCAECGSDVKRQKHVIGKRLHSEITLETLTKIMDRCHVTIFKQRNSLRLTGYKIGFLSAWKNKSKITLIFTWNLHQESMHASFKLISVERGIFAL